MMFGCCFNMHFHCSISVQFANVLLCTIQRYKYSTASEKAVYVARPVLLYVLISIIIFDNPLLLIMHVT